ncbi:MAG: hypothetical protein KIS66_00440 [Fimbriimonadaceae bacterium]|nr:hypothetical protein [Fimbriimonadaceae bacterium]
MNKKTLQVSWLHVVEADKRLQVGDLSEREWLAIYQTCWSSVLSLGEVASLPNYFRIVIEDSDEHDLTQDERATLIEKLADLCFDSRFCIMVAILAFKYRDDPSELMHDRSFEMVGLRRMPDAPRCAGDIL